MIYAHEIVIFSVQTSGIQPFRDSIVDLGAIKIDRDCVPLQYYSSLVRPRNLASVSLAGLREITADALEDAPSARQVLPAFREFLGHRRDVVLMGHGIRTSLDFLRVACSNLELPAIDHDVIDTLNMAKGQFPGFPSHSLGLLAERFGIPSDPGYRSLAQAERTRLVWLTMKREKKTG